MNDRIMNATPFAAFGKVFPGHVFRAIALLVGLLAAEESRAAMVRIKDLVDVQGVRGNDLVGYGLVVGLNRY